MLRYVVLHPYSAATAGHQLGPWQPGDEVNLDDTDAEWVLRDSPGVLKPAEPPAKSSTPKGKAS